MSRKTATPWPSRMRDTFRNVGLVAQLCFGLLKAPIQLIMISFLWGFVKDKVVFFYLLCPQTSWILDNGFSYAFFCLFYT